MGHRGGGLLVASQVRPAPQNPDVGLQALLRQKCQGIDQDIGPLGRGHAGHHDQARGLGAHVAAPRHIGQRVVHHTHPLGRHGQTRSQLFFVGRHANHARGPGGQHGLGQPGVGANQPRRLRLEAKAMHRVDHRNLPQLARQACDHPGHGAVGMDDIGLQHAHMRQHGPHRSDHLEGVERVLQAWQRQHRDAQITQGLTQHAVCVVATDHHREAHPALQGAAQLQHMRLRPTGFAFGDDQHNMGNGGMNRGRHAGATEGAGIVTLNGLRQGQPEKPRASHSAGPPVSPSIQIGRGKTPVQPGAAAQL